MKFLIFCNHMPNLYNYDFMAWQHAFNGPSLSPFPPPGPVAVHDVWFCLINLINLIILKSYDFTKLLHYMFNMIRKFENCNTILSILGNSVPPPPKKKQNQKQNILKWNFVCKPVPPVSMVTHLIKWTSLLFFFIIIKLGYHEYLYYM